MAILLLSACSKQIRFSFEASDQLNIDEGGIALPVVVRIYQLRNRDRLERADFNSLWKNDRDVLADDLLDRREITLHPNSKNERIEINRLKAAAFIGVMALFRRPDGNSWRQVIPLKKWGRRSFEISLHQRSISFVEQ